MIGTTSGKSRCSLPLTIDQADAVALDRFCWLLDWFTVSVLQTVEPCLYVVERLRELADKIEKDCDHSSATARMKGR